MSKTSTPNSHLPSSSSSSRSETERPSIKVSLKRSSIPLVRPHFFFISAILTRNLVSLGLDESDTNKASLEVYKEHFESPFIAATEKYYKTESESFLAENNVPTYLKRAEERLREEEDRIERYLNANTRKTLISRCEHVLIREHADKMWDDFQQLLDYDKDEDLQRMYALLARIPEGLEPLRKKFEEHVKRAGQSAVSKLVGEGGANVDSLVCQIIHCLQARLDKHFY
jgi:cullin 1